jgi:cytochrome c peroxidase
MRQDATKYRWAVLGAICLLVVVRGAVYAQEAVKTSYMPVAITEPFEKIMDRMKAEKPQVMKRHMDLLHERYDLCDRPSKGVMMSAGRKHVQEGVRAKLPSDMTWQKLAEMTPEGIKEKDLWPKGFFPLPHPNHPEGGMVFPKFHINEIKKQEGRDLTRFDLDFDLPDHLLPEFPPPNLSDDSV